jgi:hypothetical protein
VALGGGGARRVAVRIESSVSREEVERFARNGTRLAGLLKAYVPIRDDPPSARPYGFVFAPAVDADGGVYVELLAFGERHPRPRARSVYERAHKRLHGRYPDQ